MDLKRTAREVLENVGGEENIISIMSCFTRVRVELKDKTKVDEKAKRSGWMSGRELGRKYSADYFRRTM